MFWKVLKAEVRTKYSEALQIYQAAHNVFGHLQREVSVVQGLKQLHSMAVQMQKVGAKVDWEVIKAAVLKTKPPWAVDVECLVAFVIGKSGGQGHDFLSAFVAFHRQHVLTDRRVPAELYSVLVDFALTFLAYSLLTTAYACPPKCVASDGKCSFVTPGDIQKLVIDFDLKTRKGDLSALQVASALSPKPTNADSKEKCHQAELLLKQSRERLLDAGITLKPEQSNKLTKVLTVLDCEVGRFVLQKASKHTMLHDAGHAFVASLKLAFPDAEVSKISVGWPPATPAASSPVAAAADAAPELGLYNISAAGDVVDPLGRLRERGFDVGSCVGTMVDDEHYYRISKIEGEDVLCE